MVNKFTLEELIIRVIPGGFFLAIIFFFFSNSIRFNLIDNLDFLYTFLFFCTAFIVGEILQTLARKSEWIIDLFFKIRRPSKIFLYKNNLVLKNEHIRNKIVKELGLTKKQREVFDKDYSKLPFFNRTETEYGGPRSQDQK